MKWTKKYPTETGLYLTCTAILYNNSKETEYELIEITTEYGQKYIKFILPESSSTDPPFMDIETYKTIIQSSLVEEQFLGPLPTPEYIKYTSL